MDCTRKDSPLDLVQLLRAAEDAESAGRDGSMDVSGLNAARYRRTHRAVVVSGAFVGAMLAVGVMYGFGILPQSLSGHVQETPSLVDVLEPGTSVDGIVREVRASEHSPVVLVDEVAVVAPTPGRVAQGVVTPDTIVPSFPAIVASDKPVGLSEEGLENEILEARALDPFAAAKQMLLARVRSGEIEQVRGEEGGVTVDPG